MSESEADLAVAGSPPENEFISDAFQAEHQLDDEALKKEMQQLGVNEQDAGDAGQWFQWVIIRKKEVGWLQRMWGTRKGQYEWDGKCNEGIEKGKGTKWKM